MLAMNDGVEILEKRDSFEILVSSVLVGNPLAGFSRVVKIDHRRHRIDSQTIQVILLEPEQRIGSQEIADLVPTEIENCSAPVLVKSETWVGMFVQVGSVKKAQAMLVGRKVGRHPVQDDTNPGAMARIHEGPEVVRRAMTACRGEIAGSLIAPGSVERVLGNG